MTTGRELAELPKDEALRLLASVPRALASSNSTRSLSNRAR